MTSVRRSFPLGLLLALLFLLGAPLPSAHAEIAPGESAPDFEGRDYFNTEPTTLKEQRGHVVFLELFSVT